MKEDNKLKKFIKKHERVFIIAGGVVILVAGVGIGYGICRNSKGILQREFDRLVVSNKAFERWLEIIDLCQKGTRETIIATNPDVVTVAEFFGKDAARFMANSDIQPDDTVVNIIYNIAKKAET